MCFLLVVKHKRQAVTTYLHRLPAERGACEQLKAVARALAGPWAERHVCCRLSHRDLPSEFYERSWPKGDKKS